MVKSVVKAIEKFDMLSGVKNVTVALSGGADSMALLYILNSLKECYGYSLEAAHLNHMLRGAESDSDENLVRKTCKKIGVPLIVEHANIIVAAEQSGESVELTARNVRYDFLQRVSKGVTATAHTASDSMETVIFNATRGTGLKGLCGIPAVRDSIIRPLIFCTRSMVEQYCAENGIEYCIDSTNSDTKYSRNKIRHMVIPALREINSGADLCFSAMSDGLRDDENFLEGCAEKAYNDALDGNALKVEVLNSLHKSISSRVIVKYYENVVGLSAQRFHINQIMDLCQKPYGTVGVQKNMKAKIREGLLTIYEPEQEDISKSFFFEPNNFAFSCLSYENFIKKLKINSLLLQYAIDYDTICGNTIIRSKKVGDKLSIRQRNVTKSLKKLFNEAKIDVDMRNSVPVLADDIGVLWVEGFGADKRAAVSIKTNNVLVIEHI